MYPSVSFNQQRLTQTREMLIQLQSQGYRYLKTLDDGDTWIGSHEHSGLDIAEMIERGFAGKIASGLMN